MAGTLGPSPRRSRRWIGGGRAGGAVDCARFTGYRPCEPGKVCDGCGDRRPVSHTSLLVNLDNLGNVIQTTAVLPALRRALPDTFLTWVTAPYATCVLANNPFVDRVMPYDHETVSILRAMEFDLVMNLDKTQRSAALAALVPLAEGGERRGFGLSRRGAIEPLNPEAEYAYRLGLDDELKFRRNTKPGTRIATEALGFEWRRDPYVLELTPEEKEFAREYRDGLGLPPAGGGGASLVGINTGSSPAFPNKSLTVDGHAELVAGIAEALPDVAVVLLGGPHETEKNAEIAALAPVPHLVEETPTTEGVRRVSPPGGGLLYLDACDVVVSGDTSGLHMAIALGKWTVGYFGVTCASEIDVYDRGVVVASGLPCSPCWRPSCPDPRCITELDLDAVVQGVVRGVAGGAAG